MRQVTIMFFLWVVDLLTATVQVVNLSVMCQCVKSLFTLEHCALTTLRTCDLSAGVLPHLPRICRRWPCTLLVCWRMALLWRTVVENQRSRQSRRRQLARARDRDKELESILKLKLKQNDKIRVPLRSGSVQKDTP